MWDDFKWTGEFIMVFAGHCSGEKLKSCEENKKERIEHQL